MGAYAYCTKCEHSINGPWDVSTKELMLSLCNVQGRGVQCLGCGEVYEDYDKEHIVVELAKRIDAFKQHI